MINPKLLALLGVVLIVIGVFLPLAIDESSGTEQTLDFWDYDENNNFAADGVGVYLLAIALVAGLIVLVDRAHYVWVPLLLLVWYTLYQLPPLWALNRNDLGLTPGIGWALVVAGTVLLSAPLQWPSPHKWLESASTAAPAPRSAGFDLRRFLNWAGLILLVGGFFVPLAKIDDRLTFYTVGTATGGAFMQVIVVLAGVALVTRRSGVLWVCGLIALLVLGNDLRVIAHQADQAQIAGELRWGWLLLFDGAAVLVLTFFLGEDRRHVATVIGEFFATKVTLDDEDDAEDA
jgi:hypothetical protein